MSAALALVPEPERPSLQRWLQNVGPEEAGVTLLWFAEQALASPKPHQARGQLYGLGYAQVLELAQALLAEAV
ncbi:hypothetical protein [Hymenobacter pini]|uniref:hypothetical protein n=1 Tax=Hymenobacter pini TaxID=2880879 RepID=UPI001CF2905A|nr:hypothetical protein [Hymenobacter pini]MCA8831971.1 hypothetical protein [Hymenobacter pini]